MVKLRYFVVPSLILGLGFISIAVTIEMAPELFSPGEIVFQQTEANECTFNTTLENPRFYYLQYTCEFGRYEYYAYIEIRLDGVLIRNKTFERGSTSPTSQGAGIDYASLFFTTNQSNTVFEVKIYDKINTGKVEFTIWEDPSEFLIWLRNNNMGILFVGVGLFFGTIFVSFVILYKSR